MINLYGPRGGSSLRAIWALEEIGLEHLVIAVDLKNGEHKKPEFLAMNPAGQVPVLKDGDFILAESMAITRYLAAKYRPELLGTTVEIDAVGEQWSLWTMLVIQKYIYQIVNQKWSGKNDQAIIDEAKAELAKYFPILEKHLDGKNFVTGEAFTIHDINMAVGISYKDFCDFDISEYTNITRWLGEMTSREAYKKAKQS